MHPATCAVPLARATSTPRWIDAIQAAQEKGRTMPVVPRIDSPPRMPSRGFHVFSANAAPPGTEIVIRTSPDCPSRAAISATVSRIMCRGTGLIAGSPTATGRPGFVTMPTPSPATKTTPPSDASTRARIRAQCVTSGSSPASLMIAASAHPGPASASAMANSGRSPRGRVIRTRSGRPSPHSIISAARTAAVAQAPVVQPRRRGVSGFRLIAPTIPPPPARATPNPSTPTSPPPSHHLSENTPGGPGQRPGGGSAPGNGPTGTASGQQTPPRPDGVGGRAAGRGGPATGPAFRPDRPARNVRPDAARRSQPSSFPTLPAFPRAPRSRI